MPVGYVRPEVLSMLPRWRLVNDCLGGEEAVKAARDTYLPVPNKTDTSAENRARYEDYLTRAVFYNVTRRTLDGYVGQVFARAPVATVPEEMTALLVDVDGAGVSLDQQAKKTLSFTIGAGRCGLLVDHPPARVDEQGVAVPASKAELDAGYVRPTVTLYDPGDVINWRTVTVGARRIFALVVISEIYVLEDDGFEMQTAQQYRVLRLVPPTTPEGEKPDWSKAIYTVEIWRQVEDANAPDGRISFGRKQTYVPRDADGHPLREIPFTFVGALNNDPGVDHPPLADLAALNIAHYRNSADYEEACYMVGQPTSYAAGLTQEWVDTNYPDKKFYFGSRASLLLPEKGSAGIMQAAPNTMPKEAMETKERQMVALGAKLVEQRQVQRTAAEATQDDASASSLLATIARNVSDAYTDCLRWCAAFLGASFPSPAKAPQESATEATNEQEIRYALNTDFPAARMTPEERRQTIAEWQAGFLARSEARHLYRKAGIATLADPAAKEEIDQDPPNPGFAFEEGSEIQRPGAGTAAGAGGGAGAGAAA